MLRRKVRLEAARTYLRFPRRADFSAWSQTRNRDREHLIPWEPRWAVDANSRREWRLRLTRWKQAWDNGDGYSFLIFHQDDDHLLGGIALTNVRLGSAQSGTLGYWLAANAEGYGYMSEAVEQACLFGAKILGLRRIEAATIVENTRSQAVLERCGFAREGLAREYLQIAGTRRDHVLFGRTSLLADMSGKPDDPEGF